MAMTEKTELRPLAPPRVPDRKMLILFLLVGLALIFLLLNLAGFQKTWAMIRDARPVFVLSILLAQALRYLGSTGSTLVLARMFGTRLPFAPLYETMLAGQALNRTFSVGGAAGMFVRYSFLTRQQLHSGAVAALFVVEDVLGVVTISLVFAIGLAAVVMMDALPQFIWLVAPTFLGGAVLLTLGALQFYRRRAVVERLVHQLARAFNTVVGRLVGQNLYDRASIHRAMNEFYAGMTHARRDPPAVAGAFLYSLLRLGFDAASLYCAFWAIGFPIAPGFLLLIFTGSSALSTLSGVPGELGVMETSLAVLSTSLGIAPATAIGAIVLFRALSYWLPIPLGYLAFWHLQRRGFI